MREDVLFEITKDLLESGLRGFPVGYCVTSYVEPDKGLFYRGRFIEELSHLDPINVIYLLYHGENGTEKQIDSFKHEIESRAQIDPGVIYHIQALPKKSSPMDLLANALFILGVFEKTDDYREDCLNLIAKIPYLVAVLINYHADWGETPPLKKGLGYMKQFAHLLNVPNKNIDLLSEVFRIFNILHLDHGGGNLSTFVGKAVASGMQHLYGSLSASMSALAGPKHGGANADCLEFVQMLQKKAGTELTTEKIRQILEDRIEHHQLVYGFGHAVLRVEDPRAKIFYDFAEKKFPDHPLYKTAKILRYEGPKILSEQKNISDPFPNVDAISGTVLYASGFSYPEYYTVLFGLARCIGIAIQIVYERCIARKGKGLPIVRPKYLYKNLSSKKEIG